MYGCAYKKPKLFNKKFLAAGTLVQFSSVAQSCLTLWDFMDSSTPDFAVHHQLPELAQTHVHQVSDAIHHLIFWHLLVLSSIFPTIKVFWESVLRIRWPKYWNFSFSISLSNEYSHSKGSTFSPLIPMFCFWCHILYLHVYPFPVYCSYSLFYLFIF